MGAYYDERMAQFKEAQKDYENAEQDFGDDAEGDDNED